MSADEKKEKSTEAHKKKVKTPAAEPKKQKEPSDSPEKEELVKLKADFEAQKDLLLRTAAEYDNYKKRTMREAERIGTESRAAVVKALLPAFDNFLRSQENTDADYADYKKGVEMSIRQLTDILTSLGLTEMDCVGKPFDPALHYAVSQVEDETLGENIVSAVLQKGYQFGDLVIRPAMVAVANCR